MSLVTESSGYRLPSLHEKSMFYELIATKDRAVAAPKSTPACTTQDNHMRLAICIHTHKHTHTNTHTHTHTLVLAPLPDTGHVVSSCKEPKLNRTIQLVTPLVMERPVEAILPDPAPIGEGNIHPPIGMPHHS